MGMEVVRRLILQKFLATVGGAALEQVSLHSIPSNEV